MSQRQTLPGPFTLCYIDENQKPTSILSYSKLKVQLKSKHENEAKKQNAVCDMTHNIQMIYFRGKLCTQRI
jgi:hypothetical protein